jgi:plasmid maintenance system killer protein
VLTALLENTAPCLEPKSTIFRGPLKSFADKVTAAVFAGHEVRKLPKTVQPSARRKLILLDSAAGIDSLRARPATGWKHSRGNEWGNGASALTTNGEYAFAGAAVTPLTLR